MDFAPTDEQQLIRQTARAFADDEIVPRAKGNAGRALTGIDALVPDLPEPAVGRA